MFVKARVFLQAKKESIKEKKENSLEIRIKEKPINNQANKRLIIILAQYYKVAPAKIKLIKGARQTNKIFKIKRDE